MITKCVHNPLLTLRGHHLGHFGDQLETLRTTPGHHLGQLGHLTTWHQLGSCVATLEHYLGQLGDNFDTTLGQLGYNFEITLRQLWDNFETSLGQLGANIRTTFLNLWFNLRQLGPVGSIWLFSKCVDGKVKFRKILLVPAKSMSSVQSRAQREISIPSILDGPNIGIFGLFDPMPDQKTMQIRCLGGFPLVGGCGARAISRKTPIYFIDWLSNMD